MNMRALSAGLFTLALLPSIACTKLLGIDGDYTESKGGSSGTTTGSGGAHHTSSSTSSTTGTHTGGTGGTTAPVACTVPTDCPGAENECAHRTCEGGLCGVAFTAAGTPLGAQNAGDCKKIVCDGHGVPEQQDDDADVPEDSNPCTNDLCATGVASHTPAAFGVSCGGTLTCDGAGHCTGCTGPGDCPGQDTDCQSRACTSGICGFVYSPAGTPVSSQTGGDCKLNVCNGMGQVSVIADSSDPSDDGNECTTDGCSNGSPTHGSAAAGAPCATGGGHVCNGSGSCVECIVADTCPGQNDECRARTCNGGQCGVTFTPAGTPVSLQASGDCRKNVCDGMGSIHAAPDDADKPDDGNPCTNDDCNNGNAVFNPATNGTACGPNKTCNGVGQCVGCMTGADCPGADNECQTRQCNGGICNMVYVAGGKPVSAQSGGDCKINVCDGSGSIVTIADDGDIAPDGDACTNDLCSGGSASYPPAGAGTSCPGGVCNGAGNCGVCVPGEVDYGCCAFQSPACCYAQAARASSTEGVSVSDESPDLPPCCCEGSRDCDANGYWGGCN